MRYLLLLSFLIVAFAGCNQSTQKNSSKDAADAIYFGGDIITMEGDSAAYSEAVAVKNGKIIFAGKKSEAEKLKGDSTKMNDLKGKTLLPGFIDPHIHASIAASVLPVEIVSAMEWNTPRGKSVVVKDHDAFINRLKELDKSYEDPQKVLLAWGYFKPYHGSISKDELNSISLTRPIIVWQRSCHEFYLNDAALKHFNITEADFNKMPGYSDYKTGHVFETGLFVVTKPVLDYISNPAQFSKGLEMMTDVIHKGGLTTICEQGFPQVDLNLEQSLISKEINKPSTPFRYAMVPNAMYFYPILKSGSKVLAFCDSLINTGKDNMDYVKAVKFYVDGAIFSQLMIMSQPYEDHHHGEWMMQPKEQDDVFETFYKAGWDIHIHVNGDGGLDTLLAIIDRARTSTPNSTSKIFLEHYGYARQDQHEKVAKYGILVSNNPYYYYELSGPYSKEGLGPERASKISSIGSLEKLKVPLSFHSDYFMAPADPLLLVWSAVNRINSNGDVLAPEEKVGLFTAIKAVTIEAARSIRMEKEIGTISAGKKADFVILEENPFKIDPVKIKDISIYSTVFEGKEFKIQR
ncbi:MAG: amidohydrolase [Ignavibacteria bacterium]|nr:amidohydrolase [Ignavibacteria bacterium]